MLIEYKEFLSILVLVMAWFLSIVAVICGRVVDEKIPENTDIKSSRFTSPRASAFIFTIFANMFVGVGLLRIVTIDNIQIIVVSSVSVLFGFMLLFTVIMFSFAVCSKYNARKSEGVEIEI